MDFATNYRRTGPTGSVKEDGFSEDWVNKCQNEMHLKEGFHIEEEDICCEDAFSGHTDRHYLDIAAGAQIYMEKQMIHMVAGVHLPKFLVWKVGWWIICCLLYAPCVVKPTLRMPVLLFRRKWVLSRLSSYLYIRCSATSLKAYGKVWLTPGNWLLPESFTRACYKQALQFVHAIVQSLKWSTSRRLFKRPWYLNTQQTKTTCIPHISPDSKLYHEVNLADPSQFPLLLQHSKRFKLYRSFPSRPMSRLWGAFNKLVLPMWLRARALGLYIWMFSCKLEEAEVTNLMEYPNLRAFFTRKLKPGMRQIHGKLPLVSPADGTVLYCGKVEHDTLEQIKGVHYTMQSFMGPLTEPVFNHELVPSLNSSQSDSKLATVCKTPLRRRCSEQILENPKSIYSSSLVKNPGSELQYCTIYLAPGDYHRFHSPADWTVHSRRHFSGELFSVKPHIARWLQGLFCINERAMYVGEWKYGFFSFTAVGATNVGSIHVDFDQDLNTSTVESGKIGFYEDKSFKSGKKRGVPVCKGQDIGHFNLGSTIVLVFEAPQNFKLNLNPGQKVKYGQGIGGCLKHYQ